MVFSDSTYSVLLVSASDAFNRSVLSLLPPSRFYPVAQVPDLRAARECAPADLVIVTAPLPGGDSFPFCTRLSETSDSAILLLVPQDQLELAEEKMLPAGVMTLACVSALAENVKHERVFIVADPNGAVRSLTDTVRLENKDMSDVLADASLLTGIENMSGSETFAREGDAILWQAKGGDIVYQGRSDKAPALVPHVTATLDGEEVALDQLSGLTGHAVLSVSYPDSVSCPALALTVIPLPAADAQLPSATSGAKMVLLAGPSSSGKTTSCRRLSVQLSVLGYNVNQLSLDDYFLGRERTPKLPNGEYDFESIDALDIPLLNDHLNRLFRGEEVQIPTFDFKKGEPYFGGKTLKLGPRSLLVVEGIHALNPKLTAEIEDGLKFKVYVSALTQISIDDQNIIHGTDNRLVRRIVRDNNFRGWNAYETLRRWPEVVRGERKHIFPYQENANVMFNSALLYELGVLKRYAEPLMKQVPEDSEEYSIARQLLDFSELLLPIDDKFIPYNSIMREFLGGSAFEY